MFFKISIKILLDSRVLATLRCIVTGSKLSNDMQTAVVTTRDGHQNAD